MQWFCGLLISLYVFYSASIMFPYGLQDFLSSATSDVRVTIYLFANSGIVNTEAVLGLRVS
jgi:hypothetical protein